MDKELFGELLESVQEAGSIMRKENTPSRIFKFTEPDVKAIRKKMGLSQSKFAMLIGINMRTLQNWEQGHRHPTGPAKILLKIVQANPEVVIETLNRT